MFKVLKDFYAILKNLINNVPTVVISTDILIGIHPTLNLNIYKCIARYGPVVKLIENNKTKMASIKEPYTFE